MSINPLAAAIAAGIEATRAVDEERIRQIVKEELAALGRDHAGPAWATPPRAAEACGVGVKRVRALIAAGVVQTRARNLDAKNAKQIKQEINIASLEAALAGEAPKLAPVTDATSWAAARAARKAGA